MRRVVISCLWLLWVTIVTMITIVLHVYLNPCPAPRSSIVEFVAGRMHLWTSVDVDVMTLAWGFERVVPAHLAIYLAWRTFKAVFLR